MSDERLPQTNAGAQAMQWLKRRLEHDPDIRRTALDRVLAIEREAYAAGREDYRASLETETTA